VPAVRNAGAGPPPGRARPADVLVPELPAAATLRGRGHEQELTMGFMDKVKDSAQKAGEKIQSGVDAGMEKVEETKLKRQIEGNQKEIGALVYRQRTGSGPADVDAQIAKLVDEIKDCEAKIAAG
jgi:hypothetical protein